METSIAVASVITERQHRTRLVSPMIPGHYHRIGMSKLNEQISRGTVQRDGNPSGMTGRPGSRGPSTPLPPVPADP